MSVADPGFSQGGANPQGGCRDTILLNFPENCMKSRTIWSLGWGGGGGRRGHPLDPPLNKASVFDFILWWQFRSWFLRSFYKQRTIQQTYCVVEWSSWLVDHTASDHSSVPRKQLLVQHSTLTAQYTSAIKSVTSCRLHRHSSFSVFDLSNSSNHFGLLVSFFIEYRYNVTTYFPSKINTCTTIVKHL